MDQTPQHDSQHSTPELLERGRLALQAIQFREQAARFRAEASSLQAALLQAESGDDSTLRSWLESRSSALSNDPELEDSMPVITEHPLQKPSPWGVMEQAARKRLSRLGKDLETISIERGLQDLSVESRDIKDVARDEIRPPSPFLEDDFVSDESADDVTEQQLGDLWYQESTADLDETFESAETIDSDEDAVPDELISSIVGLDDVSRETRKWTLLGTTHVWVSLVLHVVLVVVLSAVAISVAKQPQLMSIVSATVEADNILMETPMEMVSEMESAEPSPAENAPGIPDLPTNMALPSIELPTGTIASGTSPTSSVAAALAGGGGGDGNGIGMTGSKMVAGAEFFGVKATGNTFVYIVDSSPSMRRDGAFDAAKQELLRSLSSMKPTQRYFVSFFGKEIDPMEFQSGVVEKYPVYAKPENLSKTLDWLGRVQIQREGMPPNEALSEAIAMQPDAIFLLFDGDTKSEVAKYLRRINRSTDILSSGSIKVPIHVVHFFQEEFQKPMKQIAEENGGTYRFVPRPERPLKGKR